MADAYTPDPTTPRRLAILVVNYGSQDLLARNLVPLTRAIPEALTFVTDNFKSTEDSQEAQRLASENGWHLVQPGVNLGFGAGMNRAAEAAIRASASDLLLLNPDAHIESSAVRALWTRIQEHPDRLVVPRVLTPDGRSRSTSFYVSLLDGSMSPGGTTANGIVEHRLGFYEWVGAACLMTSASTWQTIGGFAEDYFLYWEDVELSVRATTLGVQLEVMADQAFTHDQGGTQFKEQERSSEAKSELYYYYNIRNRLVFAARNLDPAQRRAWLRRSWAANYQILRRGGRRQFTRPISLARVALRATRDGRQALKDASG